MTSDGFTSVTEAHPVWNRKCNKGKIRIFAADRW